MSASFKVECKKILYKLAEELCELSVEVLHLANKDKENVNRVYSEIEDVEKQIGRLREYMFAHRDDM